MFFSAFISAVDTKKNHPVHCLWSISLIVISALSHTFSFHGKINQQKPKCKTRVRLHSSVASLEHVTTVFNIHEHSRRV